MNDSQIFMVGLFVSTLLFGGLGITVFEFHRMNKKYEEHKQNDKAKSA